jgi:hypothetical protein
MLAREWLLSRAYTLAIHYDSKCEEEMKELLRKSKPQGWSARLFLGRMMQ